MKNKIMLLLQGCNPDIAKAAVKYVNEEIGPVKGIVILGDKKKDLGELGITVIYDENLTSLERIKQGLAIIKPEKVYDLSGSPWVSTADRNEFAYIITSEGITYEGMDFSFTEDHKEMPLLRDFILHKSNVTTLCILGTGHQVGKTYVINSIASYLKKYKPLFITMSTEGNLKPGIISSKRHRLTSKDIIELNNKEKNITSDNWHIALSTASPVIDCFKVGEAYRTGVAAFSNIWEGTEIAQKFDTKLLIYQGSVIGRPPVRLNGEIVIIGADQNPDRFGKIERYSIIKADMIIITKCEDPYCDRKKLEKLRKFINSLISTHLVVETIFRAKPVVPDGLDLKNQKIFLKSNLPEEALKIQKEYLKKHYYCNIVQSGKKLTNKSNKDFDILLTEYNEDIIDLIEKMEKLNKKVIIYKNELIPSDEKEFKKSLEEVVGLAFARNN